jgi:hypothetical protein
MQIAIAFFLWHIMVEEWSSRNAISEMQSSINAYVTQCVWQLKVIVIYVFSLNMGEMDAGFPS